MLTTVTSWGYSVLASDGTATAALTTIVPKGTRVKVSAIVVGYSVTATTADFYTVTDGNNVTLMTAAGMASGVAVSFTPTVVCFSQPIEMDGIKVGAAGATTGYCSIFTSND
jgi:hypothetical protein